MSVAMDTDQSVSMVQQNKVEVRNENVYWYRQWSREFLWWYQVVWRVLNLTAYYYSGRAVLFVLIMEEEEEMVGRQFNSFEELERSYLRFKSVVRKV